MASELHSSKAHTAPPSVGLSISPAPPPQLNLHELPAQRVSEATPGSPGLEGLPLTTAADIVPTLHLVRHFGATCWWHAAFQTCTAFPTENHNPRGWFKCPGDCAFELLWPISPHQGSFTMDSLFCSSSERARRATPHQSLPAQLALRRSFRICSVNGWVWGTPTAPQEAANATPGPFLFAVTDRRAVPLLAHIFPCGRQDPRAGSSGPVWSPAAAGICAGRIAHCIATLCWL